MFTTELSNLPMLSSAGPPQNITPSRGPDLHPNRLRQVTARPADVAETPWPVLLSLRGAAIGTGALLLLRLLRRRTTSAVRAHLAE